MQKKIEWVLQLIQVTERVPSKFLRHLEGSRGLFEVRVESGGNIFRVFCFFYSGNELVLLNAFQKKTNKTPSKEIDKALNLLEAFHHEQKN